MGDLTHSWSAALSPGTTLIKDVAANSSNAQGKAAAAASAASSVVAASKGMLNTASFVAAPASSALQSAAVNRRSLHSGAGAVTPSAETVAKGAKGVLGAASLAAAPVLSGLKAAAAASNKSSLAAQSSEWFHLSGGSSSGRGSRSGSGQTVRNAKIVKKVKPANHVTTSLVNTPAFAPCNGSGAGASLANRPGLEPCNGSTTAVVQSESSSTSLAAPRSAPVGLSVHSAARAAVSAVSKAASSLTSAMKSSASSRNTNVGDAARAGLALQGRATPNHGLLSSTANGHAIQASSHQANVESHDASAAADNVRAADADRSESLAIPDTIDGAPNSAKAGLAVQGRPRNMEHVSGNDATALPVDDGKDEAWAWRKAQMLANRKRRGPAAPSRNTTVRNSTKQNQKMQWAQPESNSVSQTQYDEAPAEAMTANANHDVEVARADKDTHSAARYQG